MNLRILLPFGAVLVLMAGVPTGPDAAAASTASAAPSVTEAGATAAVQPATPEAPPRTLRAHWHVFAAFAVGWILLFGYLVWIAVRLRRAEQSLAEIAAGSGRSSA